MGNSESYRLRKCDCSTMEKLCKVIIQVWYHDDDFKKMCPILVDSMPDPVKMLINAKGGHIGYKYVIFYPLTSCFSTIKSIFLKYCLIFPLFQQICTRL